MNEELKTASDIVRDPSSISFSTYWWVVVLAIWGGIVRVIREVKLGGKTFWQIILAFVAEAVVSAFAGMLVFFLCESSNMPRMYTAALVGIAGYMGGRALNLLEAIYKSRTLKGE